jgi:hypothetical protein
MSDQEANDVNGYGICFECREAVPNSELLRVCVHRTRHAGDHLDAYVCGECTNYEMVFTLEDTPDPDHVPATCGIPNKLPRRGLLAYRVGAFVVQARSDYEATVKVVRSFLTGKEVPRG